MHTYDKLRDIAYRVDEIKENFLDILSDFKPKYELWYNLYVGGGCIYSLFNSNTFKDIDMFCRDEMLVKAIESHVRKNMSDVKVAKSGQLILGKYKGNSIVISSNSITFKGEFVVQLVKRDYGSPIDVVNRFDFKHNMFWIEGGRVHTASSIEYLNQSKLYFNDNRARDMVGTIMRVNKYIKRGMEMDSAEMAKMLLRLNDIGITEREVQELKGYGLNPLTFNS